MSDLLVVKVQKDVPMFDQLNKFLEMITDESSYKVNF